MGSRPVEAQPDFHLTLLFITIPFSFSPSEDLNPEHEALGNPGGTLILRAVSDCGFWAAAFLLSYLMTTLIPVSSGNVGTSLIH